MQGLGAVLGAAPELQLGWQEMERIGKRFKELDETAAALIDGFEVSHRRETYQSGLGLSRTPETRTRMVTDRQMDYAECLKWRVSALSLLHRVLGDDNTTYLTFSKTCDAKHGHEQFRFKNLYSIFRSAREEYDGGHLFDVRNLIHADVFADELEQAKHFLDKGHKVPAAVIAGTVLESTMREICNQTPDLEPSDNINKMNDDLANGTAINGMQKKQITAWAAIRNDAAHGRPDELEPRDVDRMIDGIRDFVASTMA